MFGVKRVPNSFMPSAWECPECGEASEKYISWSVVTKCPKCKELLSWDGEKVITYDEWLKNSN